MLGVTAWWRRRPGESAGSKRASCCGGARNGDPVICHLGEQFSRSLYLLLGGVPGNATAPAGDTTVPRRRRGPRGVGGVSPGAGHEGPAPGPTEAPLRSARWSGRPSNHLIQQVGCFHPGGRMVPVSRNSGTQRNSTVRAKKELVFERPTARRGDRVRLTRGR